MLVSNIFVTFPFVCSRTIFLSQGTGKVDEEEFLIVGGKPSGRGAEFAFSDKDPPKKFERFKKLENLQKVI